MKSANFGVIMIVDTVFCANNHCMRRGDHMRFSYAKLWKLLIDKKMVKRDLMEATGVTSSTIAKMGKEQPVTLEVLGRICKALDCNIGDIVDVVFDD